MTKHRSVNIISCNDTVSFFSKLTYNVLLQKKQKHKNNHNHKNNKIKKINYSDIKNRGGRVGERAM